MKFLVPSKGRHDRIHEMIEFVGPEDMIVYVDEAEEYNYEPVRFMGVELRTHPGLYGMGSILKYLLEDNLDEDYVVIIADDVVGFCYKFHQDMPRDWNGERYRWAIRNSYQMALDIETPLFGWAYDKGIYFYNQLNPFAFGGYCSNMDIIPSLLGDVMFDPRMVIGEDHDFCLQVKYHHRYFLLDLRYATIDKTWTNQGGCSTLRHTAIYEERNRLLLRKYGPNVIRINRKKPKQIRIGVPF